jgi:hypothetical protein
VTPELACLWAGRDGLVTLRGQVSGGAQGSYLGTLPVGARPATRQVFVTVATDGYGQVDVLPTGEIYARAVSGSWFSVDSVTFRAAD